MENKERKSKIIAVDRRGYHGVTLTRKAAERYGFERMLRLPGNYRKIEAEAFKGNLKIEQMELSDSVLELGTDAFRNCNALKEAVLPDHLAVIGEGCFAECPQLRHVKIPSYVDTIKDATFLCDRRLQKVEFAAWSRLTRIGVEAFMECKTLEKIDLPDSIQQIGNRAFRRCKMLADIHLYQQIFFSINEVQFHLWPVCLLQQQRSHYQYSYLYQSCISSYSGNPSNMPPRYIFSIF